MKRPITVLGSRRATNSHGKLSTGTAYALIPLVIGVPIVGYFMAQAFHLNINQFAPLLFIVSGLGLATIFFIAAESQKQTQRQARKAAQLKVQQAAKPTKFTTTQPSS